MSETKKEKASDYPTAAGYRDWLRGSLLAIGREVEKALARLDGLPDYVMPEPQSEAERK